jgi:hypothetical protein
LIDALPASGRTQASLKNGECLLEACEDLEAGMTGTSGPIDADGNRSQRAKQASSMSFGREGAICEKDEIMQISPVRATERRL